MPSHTETAKPRLTIGLPTFNGARFLRDTLKQIEAQTFGDFVVVISDNASTDETPEIAKEIVARDSRFHYVRHDPQLDVQDNYKFLLNDADTQLYMWRADDDVWPENYLEKLVGLFDAHPHIKLAVPKHVGVHFKQNNTITREYKAWGTSDSARMKALIDYPESWMYGVFDRERIRDVMDQMKNFKMTRGWGMTIIYYFIVKNIAAGTNDTYFQWMGYVDQGHVRITGELLPETRIRKAVGMKSNILSNIIDRIAGELQIFRFKTARKLTEVEPLLALRREAFRLAYRWSCEEIENPIRRLRWRLFIYRWLGKSIYEGRRALKYKLLRKLIFS